MRQPTPLLAALFLLPGCAASGALAPWRGLIEALIWGLIVIAALVVLRAARQSPPLPPPDRLRALPSRNACQTPKARRSCAQGEDQP